MNVITNKANGMPRIRPGCCSHGGDTQILNSIQAKAKPSDGANLAGTGS